MKRVTYYVLPAILGGLLSACSTQDSQSDTSTLKVVESAPQDNERTREQALRQQFDRTTEKVTRLSQTLDQKERDIVELANQPPTNAQRDALQTLRQERDALEDRFNQARMENERLLEQLDKHSAARTADSVQQSPDYIELNKNFRTVDSERYALSKDYRDLAIEQAILKGQHTMLTRERDQLQQTLETMAQEKAQLQAALADARAQHQVLWDKIRVQGNVIDSLEHTNAQLNERGKFVSANDRSETDDDSAAELNAHITRLEAELAAQNTLIRDYQANIEQLMAQDELRVNRLKALDKTYQEVLQRNQALNAQVEQLQQTSNARTNQIKQLEQRLSRSQSARDTLQARLETLLQKNEQIQQTVNDLQDRAEQQAQSRVALENQVNQLIPFEGAISSLQRQLSSELTNARWKLPTSANLNDTFEIQFSAQVDNPIAGQIFYAELIVDSALNMLSAAEAESAVENGRINFRWRLSGLNERPNARMNVAINQSVNYDGQQILRKVYRDSETVELISTDWLSKYGYWAIAILGGLLLGFGAARLGRSSREK